MQILHEKCTNAHWRKVVACLLAVLTLVGLFPFSSLAAGPTGGVGGLNPGSPGGQKPTTYGVAWTVDPGKSFLRFTLIEFPGGVVTDIGNTSSWQAVGTPLNVVWTQGSQNTWTADFCRSKLVWFDSNAMLFNSQGANAAQLMGGTVSYYSAASGNNQRRVMTANEFAAGSGITAAQMDQIFHCASPSWSTAWLDGDYTSMWGTDPKPVTPNNLYKVYKPNNAFLYLLGRLSETGGAGTGWTQQDAISHWCEYVHDAAGNLRTKYRIIVEPGVIFQDPDGVYRANTLREAMAYSLYNSEPMSKYNLIWDQNATTLNMAQWMRQAKNNQFLEYPLDASGNPTGEELHSVNGFTEADSFVDSITSASKIRDTIFTERRSYGLHILSPFNFEHEAPAPDPAPMNPYLEVTKMAGGSIPAGTSFNFTVTYTTGSPTDFSAKMGGSDCTSQVTATGNGLKFSLKAGETIHIDFEADESFRFEVTEDDPSQLTGITGSGGTADMTAKKFVSSGGAARVVFTNGTTPSEPDTPEEPVEPPKPPKPAETILYKRDALTNSGVGPATFKFSSVTNGVYEFDTDEAGALEPIQWWDPSGSAGRYLKPGEYAVTELVSPPGYEGTAEVQQIKLELDADGEPIPAGPLVFQNLPKVGLKIVKYDRQSHQPMSGVTFEIFKEGTSIGRRETDGSGTILLTGIDPGTYRAVEVDTGDDGHILDASCQEVELSAGGGTKELIFFNDSKPGLKLVKVDSANLSQTIPGAKFRIRAIDGSYGPQEFTTDAGGEIDLSKLPAGSYEVTELECPGYVVDEAQRIIHLHPNDTAQFVFTNTKKPGLKLVNDTFYYTDENGMIELPELDTGWYKVKEVEPPAGYMLKEPSEQILYVEHDKGSTITFENIPKSALVIRKIDAATGEPLANAWFRARYLGGTSGSGGTIIGEYQTSANGNIIVTGLDAGTYIAEEISAPHGYVMDTAPQTAYISGKEQDCITLTFTNSKYGSLLIKKVDSVTKEPLSDVQFFVSTSDGAVVGNANGYFTTDSAGTILVGDIKPGTTLVVKETKTIPGYILDDTPQTVKIESNETKTLEFRNQPTGSLLVRKVCATNPSVTLQNAEFKIAYADGSLVGDANGVFRTNESGEIRVEGLTPGKSVVVTEVKAPAGFLIDTAPQTAVIQSGKTVTLTFKDQPKGKLIVQKRDSQTGEVLPGAEFRITTAAGCEVGLDGVVGSSTLTSNGIFTTNAEGEIRITNLAPGAYVVNEIKAPDGYVIDTPSTNVVIGQGGDTQTVVIKNTKKGGLIIEKYDSVTKQPLAGARFKVTTASGELVPDNEGLTSSNGLYTTDANGQIVLSKLLPGTYVVTEDKAPDNYRKDPTPQTVVVNAGDTQTVRFYDEPLCSLTILKRDSVTKKPLKGAEFTVKYSDGRDIGKYTTGTDGTAIVTGMQPGATIVVSESRAPKGYILDETPKHIVVRSGADNSLTFDNEPGTTLIIRKFIDGTENEPLSGVAFKVVDGNGGAVGPDDGIYYTDKAGEIVLDGIEPGTTVKVREIKTVDGFVLDGTPQDIKIKGGEVQSLTFWNKRAGTLLIEKLDSVTKAPLAGAQFKVVYADGRVVDTEGGKLSSNGIYLSDSNGQIKITGLVGTVVVTEEKAPDGYVMDVNAKSQTVVVNPNDTQTLRFYNDPLCSLTLTKRDSVTGKPVPNTEFTVKDGNGTVLGRYTTGKDGTVTVTGLIPGSTVVVTETKVPSGYVLNSTPQTITLKKGMGNTVTSGGTGSSGGTGTGTGSGNDLTFENDPKTRLVIEKYITGTTTPLKGVTFLVTDSSGELLGNENGEFTTDANGRIVIEGLEPGTTITAKEIRTLEGYVLDSTPKSIKIKVGAAQTLKFYNQKKGCIVIRKLDSVTKKPLAGVEFQLTYADGSYVDADNGHLSSKGLYTTNKNGEIRVCGVTGTIVVTESKTIDGYTIDEATRTQSVKVNAQDTQYLTFYNDPIGGLELIKVSEADKTQRIPDTTFEIRRASDGGLVKTVTTGKNGRVYLDLDAGSYYAVEIEAAEGFKLDGTQHPFTVQNGRTSTLTVTNAPFSGIIIHKVDSITGEGIYDVKFLVYDQNKKPIGEYSTDNRGYIYIDDLTVKGKGKLFIRELEAAPGYELDKEYKTVYVQPGKTIEIEWKNTPTTGQIQVLKYAAEASSVTGTAAGAPLQGAVYEITEARSGKVVDQITTDARGVAASKPLPLGRYKIREVTAPAYWLLSGKTFDETLEYPGQIIKVSDHDKPVKLGVTITKRGNAEVLSGSLMRYDFTVANTSNVPLEKFYWHERVPTDATRAMLFTTGTYSAKLNYRILYKTNYTADYRVLASNLNTASNYSFSLNAIPTQAGEYVTDIYLEFGKVPVGFQSTGKPTLTVQVLGTVPNGYQIVNRADVGGRYLYAWQTAQASWLTVVRKLIPTIPLPKTGY